MFLFDLKQTWEDYKYYVVVAAILIVVLLIIVISCVVSAGKKKKAKSISAASVEETPTDSSSSEPETSDDSVVVSTMSEETPVEETPVEEAPVEDAPVEETPVEDAPVEEAPVEEAPVEEAPVEEAPVEDAPVEEAPVEDAPVEDAPVEDAPVEEAPVEETPVEEAPVEDAPVEEAPVEEAPVEDASVEEAPVKKSTKSTVKGKYVILPDAEGFKYILKASNGESLIVSETYTTITGCKNAIKRLKENSKDAELKIEQDKKKNFQFHVVRGTRIVAHSANYSTKTSAVNASNSFLKFVESEKVEIIEETDDVKPELVDLSKEEISTDTVGKVVISKENDLYLYKLIANNGQVICMSPTYKTLATIKNSITKFQEAVYAGKFYMICDKNNNYQFKLYSAQNRLIMTGESFTSKDACRNNIASCYRFAKNAVVEDSTLVTEE